MHELCMRMLHTQAHGNKSKTNEHRATFQETSIDNNVVYFGHFGHTHTQKRGA